MENASKGLLIAAAVLIVILIVTFALKILNTTNGVDKTTQKAGEEVSFGVESATEDIVNVLEKNLIRIKKHTVKLPYVYESGESVQYKEYLLGTYNVLLEPKKKYRLSFDYNVISCENGYICCTIGCGEDKYYRRDLASIIYYNIGDSKRGKVDFEYTLPDEELKYRNKSGAEIKIDKPYLRLRLVRMEHITSSCEVEISNIKFIEIE